MKLGTPSATDVSFDDSVILRVYAQWAQTMAEALDGQSGPPKAHARRNEAGVWEIAFSISRGVQGERRQRHFVAVTPDGIERPDRWPLVKLAPQVWDLPVSVHVPSQFHGFVTLLGVPTPAPWERP